MSEFLDRISKLSPQRLALLADELNERVRASEESRKVPLAIVGIGCRLPGGVQDAEGFWKLLREGVDAVCQVPPSRWDVDEFYDANPDTPGKMATRWGGFIDGHDQFDPKFFGIAPAEAASMDPQQRLLLETAWEALEDAGIAPSSLSGTSTGVYVGICNGDYGQVALSAPREQITPHIAAGLSHAVAAGRISYVLGLQGPSLAVDTSCSASLVAVHLACQSLRLRECDAALAGGVNLVLNPEVTIALSQSRMMAPDGKCKAFSDAADGFVRAEGCGMIVLKRLPDAVRDRNRILAVIRGSACNQDGRSSGLTAPNGPSQEAVVAAALADAGMRADDIDYIEAHGTGTALGDPIELGALNAVFRKRPAASGPLLVGSVKTNLGHLESAAGIAGLMKLVLSIHHGKIPASLHFGTPNRSVEWDRLPIQIPAQLQDWTRKGKKRAGGVSSFGFSGTNAHVIVEQYVEENRPGAEQGIERAQLELSGADHPSLFPLSAKTESALQQIALRLADHLKGHPSLLLAEIARTLNTGRSHFEYRAAFVAASRAELLTLFDALAGSDVAAVTHRGRAAAHSRAAFVFGDERHFGINFARDLYESVPVFREALLQCEQILQNELDRPLTSQLYPEIQAASGSDGLPEDLWRPAAFALQFALAESWRSCGIEPTAVCGYGVGEMVAACVAGVFRVEDALHLAVAQGRGDADEFAQRARATEFHKPNIAFIVNGTHTGGIQVDSPNYWLRNSNAMIPSAAALEALTREGCAANLAIGDRALLQSIQHAGAHLGGNWIASLGEGSGSRRQFLNAAAALYVTGLNVDMSRFYSNVVANSVTLPTYPFERERYWILTEDGDRRLGRSEDIVASMPNNPTDDGETSLENWIYELAWEPKPLPAVSLTRPAAPMEEEVSEISSVTPASDELARIADLNRSATPVYAAYILQALCEAGLSPLPQHPFRLAELSERLKITPNRRRILARLFGILVEDKVVEQSGDLFRFIDFKPRPDADAELQRLGTEYPECRIELNILRRCGRKLSAVLLGTYDPMQLVFADGSVEEAEQIYEKSPVCRFFNDKTADAVRVAVDRIEQTEGRAARVLEIGAGTGATTAPVLEALRGTNFEYCYTDISPVFLSRARVKFSAVPAMEYRILDVEKDPADQNFQAGGYDIILAANVLHATADLRRTLANVRKLLAPRGLLLLIEGMRPDRWLDLTFGLTDGWWRFVDFDLRPQHPLISAETWQRVLNEVGIGNVRTVSYAMADGSLSQQTVIVGRADTGATELHSKFQKEWLIFADRLGIGNAVAKSLNDLGQRCETIPRPDTPEEVSALLQKLRRRTDSAGLQVVYLWAMDAAGPIVSADMLQKETELCGKTLIHLIQALPVRGKAAAPISIVTRGAQATAGFAPSTAGAVQSVAWGVGRVLGLESPERYGRLIDVDPATPPDAAAASVIAELFASDREDQIAYRGDRRLAARLCRSSLQRSANGASAFTGLRHDDSYLLIGGLGGVGLQVAKWAAEQHAGHLVLLGRTGAGSNAGAFAAERQAAIQHMEKLGTRVTVVEGDVASEADMTLLFRRFGKELPPLRGVFHAATVVHAAELGDLNDEQLDDMLRPKVLGAWVLHELTKNLNLDFFLAFSSTTSVLGAKGVAHYAAANQFMDAFAHFRRAAGLPMLSINWGAWNVMRLVSMEGQARLNQTGILPMSSKNIFKCFGELIASPRAEIVIANIDWNVLKPIYEAQRARPLLEHFGARTQRGTGNRSSIPELHAGSLLDMAAMAPADRSKFIETFVREHAAQVLGFRRGELPPADVPLTDLGLDSLMAVDLKNRLQTGIGRELSATVVFDYPTASAMAGLLDTMLWAGDGNLTPDLASSNKDEIRI